MEHVNIFNQGEKDFIPYGEQISLIAGKKPNEIALIELDAQGQEVEKMTWIELEQESNRIGRLLMAEGVRERDVVAVSLPNGITHILCTVALWKIGACYLPLCWHKAIELERIAELAEIKLSIGYLSFPNCTGLTGEELRRRCGVHEALPLPPKAVYPSKIMTSGGSTGNPKLIVNDYPSGNSDDTLRKWFKMSGQDFNQTQLLCGPLYHGAPSGAAFAGLFVGNTLIIPVEFNAEKTLDYLEQYKIDYVQLVPTMMIRILRAENFHPDKLASLKAMMHTGSHCGEWLKGKWIEILGPEKVFEIYSMSEMIGMTIISGSEWLEHRGSVGKPIGGECKVSVRDSEGNPVQPSHVGTIYMKPSRDHLPTRYIGNGQLIPTEDGYYSVGDMGYLDEEGYLYFCDRRFDMIVTGGENVFASEVQNALLSYDSVLDAVVIGLPDDYWGKRIHAIVQASSMLNFEEVNHYLKKQLLPYKIPKTYEQIDHLPREKNGKINLQKLLEERLEAMK